MLRSLDHVARSAQRRAEARDGGPLEHPGLDIDAWLRRARERSHVLCGLAVAVSNVDEVVATIRASADPAEARLSLMTRR